MRSHPGVGKLAVVVAVAVALPAVAAGQERAAGRERRNQIQILEGVLTGAVRLAADDVGRRMEQLDPTLTVLRGQARSRGFVLEGYGFFFDVEIPALRPSVVASMMAAQRDADAIDALNSLKRALETMPEGPASQQARQAYQQVARVVGPARGGVVAAASTDPDKSGIPPVQMRTEDPEALYSEGVKNALIDAMLDFSLRIDLGPEEWLIVAARDGYGPLSPNEIYDASTIQLRVKGSDLAIYHADRSRRGEIRAKVEVKVF